MPILLGSVTQIMSLLSALFIVIFSVKGEMPIYMQSYFYSLLIKLEMSWGSRASYACYQFNHKFWCSWLGMLPGTWAYVSAGAFGQAIIVSKVFDNIVVSYLLCVCVYLVDFFQFLNFVLVGKWRKCSKFIYNCVFSDFDAEEIIVKR